MGNGQMKTLKRVLAQVKKYWLALTASVVLAAGYVVMSLYIPILVGDAIDCIVEAGRVDYSAMTGYLQSVAFCCISTGEFHFPHELAADIAVETVRDFLQREASVQKVIFNVFKDLDKELYEKRLHTR